MSSRSHFLIILIVIYCMVKKPLSCAGLYKRPEASKFSLLENFSSDFKKFFIFLETSNNSEFRNGINFFFLRGSSVFCFFFGLLFEKSHMTNKNWKSKLLWITWYELIWKSKTKENNSSRRDNFFVPRMTTFCLRDQRVKGHYLAGSRCTSLSHQKSTNCQIFTKLPQNTNSTLLILVQFKTDSYLLSLASSDRFESSNLFFNHGPLILFSQTKTDLIRKPVQFWVGLRRWDYR